MLIIFDLDDTLIATSSEVTPIKLHDWLENYRPTRFEFNKKALVQLLRLNLGARSSLEALLEFCEMHGYPIDAKIAKEPSFLGNGAVPDPIRCLDGCIDLLKKLDQAGHVLAIVTRGEKKFQQSKIEASRLPQDLFYQIICVEQGSKKNSYEALKNALKLSPEQIVVIGDRVEADLHPAKQLHFHTIHLKGGRSAFFKFEDETVDYQICSLNGVSATIEEIEMKNLLRIL